jgi:RNA polymerase sigma-70 factor, ECF subfamily
MRRRLFARSSAPAAGTGSGADPDIALVVRALKDRREFDPLFERYWEQVFKFCYARLGDWHSAEDAASDVFLRALANLHNFDPSLPGTSFRSWLFGIARHVVASSHRAAAGRPQTTLDEALNADSGKESLEEQVLAAERHDELRRLLHQLPADQRELLELRLAGLSAVEIGRVMGRSQEAIRKAQSRSVIGLRDALRHQRAITDGKGYG